MNYDDNSLIIGESANKDFIDILISTYDYRTRKYFYDDLINKEVIELYNDFIDKCARMIKELKVNDNSLLNLIIIKELIEKGIFSVNLNRFDYQITNKELINHLGINIIGNEGYCRNIASFAYDIFNKLDIYNIIGYVAYKSKSANHMINIIDINGNKFGYDLLSGNLFNFTSSTYLSALYEDIILELKLSFYLNDGLSYDKLLAMLDSFKNSIGASIDNFEELNIYSKDIIYNNKDLINDFWYDTKPQKDKILKLIKTGN